MSIGREPARDNDWQIFAAECVDTQSRVTFDERFWRRCLMRGGVGGAKQC